MPANRSRTENWKHCLAQIAERGGTVEMAVKVDHLLNPGGDLIWRVKLLSVNEREIVVEQPAVVGRQFRLSLNTELVVGMTIGQNRWMFATRVMGVRSVRSETGRAVSGLIVALPERVERCSRRSFYRVSTAEFQLPAVDCWPLLDPASVVAAETANRLAFQDHAQAAGPRGLVSEAGGSEASVLPDVGPRFTARLLNISGGGLGLLLDDQQQGGLEASGHLWVRVNLRPHLPLPVAVTSKRAHWHRDSSGAIYVGLSFDFAYHPAHQQFVVDALTRYVESVEAQQRLMRAREAA
jgi:c-di-GMP-binding flagellar brake protein YcgR